MTVAQGIPESFDIKLKYCEATTYGPSGANGIDTNQWRLNSIYDPNLTGVGHQPLNRDTWSNIFTQYLVVGCDVKVTFVNQDSLLPAYCGIMWSENTSNPDTLTECLEQKHSHFEPLAAMEGGGLSVITKHFDMHEFHSTFTVQKEADNWTNVGASPGWTAVLTTVVGNLQTETRPDGVQSMIELTYYVKYRHPLRSLEIAES